ncbi:uncharacterized protein si:ch211-137a8.2 isoform X2 [Epinephelus fuscoguttatus]|uniref:uncharacterized protein si:ch211-137a8.2 isoform X2 n=1 Tax=Epinephelus fuscoguttatus TaxID=293821 RepID=UPI0020D0DA62|nr:uncharacterized protein si:ch211-137a8.2 isoform X2 [Epinephelus fuscoguttatus]
MPGSLATSERHPNTEGQEVRDMELFLDLSESPFLSTSSAASEQQGDGSWSQDGDLQGCGQLERKWVLWHEFMKEHAHLDTWLRLAEQAVSSPNSAHVTCITAKEELRKFERLRCEAGSRLVQLDSLTQKNRTLTRLFQGAMQARLLALARECGQRWDNVNAKLESITRQLKLFVSEWEGFEAEREELTLWLADLDIRLTDVDHLTGNTCEKLRQLQVFEDDWILSQATDSGCPSETLLEEEGALDKASLDLPALSNHPKDSSQSANYTPAFSSPIHPPPQSSPTHEHQGLEWDPSVDVGRSVSRDDADSSYFSVSTGLCHRDGVKRRSYLSSLGSLSDISNDINNQEADLRLEGWLDHAQPSVFPPVTTQRGGTRTNRDQWATSTPDRQDGEPVSFDGGRVRAWLGVQSPSPPERRTSCSRAVQTDGQVECYLDERHSDAPNHLRPHFNNTQQSFPAPSSSPSHDLKASPDWTGHRYGSDLQAEEEQSCCEEAERLLSEQSMTSSSRASSSLLCPALLYLLLAAALALLAYLIWVVLEPPCHRSSRMHRSFHLALRYVNGPPPT